MRNEEFRYRMHQERAKRAGTLLARGKMRIMSYGSSRRMVQGTAAALPEAWQTYRTLEEARTGGQEMLHNHRVLRVAVIEKRIPLQFVEWVGR